VRPFRRDPDVRQSGSACENLAGWHVDVPAAAHCADHFVVLRLVSAADQLG